MTELIPFRGWPKTPRLNNVEMTITEKVDGTHGAIYIEKNGLVRAASRNRFLTPEDDNHGFSRWVLENQDRISEVFNDSSGVYYGEWAGPGIQGNPLKLPEKRFFLFGIRGDGQATPLLEDIEMYCIPQLYHGPLDVAKARAVYDELMENGSRITPGARPEGVVIDTLGGRVKLTARSGPKGLQ